MKIRLLYFCVCLVVSLCSFANGSDDSEISDIWYEQWHWPEVSNKAANAAVLDPNSEVNTGGEPFSEFINKFVVDKEYRMSRMFKPGRIYEDDGPIDIWDGDYSELYGPEYFQPKYYKDQCTEHLKTYHGITPDQVLFFDSISLDCDPDNPEEDALDGGGFSYWRFVRIDGKWYFSDVLEIG